MSKYPKTKPLPISERWVKEDEAALKRLKEKEQKKGESKAAKK